MADTLTKPKMQLRSSPSMNGGDKSPTTKLLINHGKPNFTIQRSPKTPQSGNPLSPPVYGNNNNNGFRNFNGNGYANGSSPTTLNGNDEFIVSSTKFNGVIKPSELVLNAKQQQQVENEAAKVVLRRAKIPEPATRDDEDDSVPEFIRRQRRIQERLAKENILDFENRRSGYFTQVMISPSSPNRTSFVETMSSPAIVPALEIPPPAPATPVVQKEETIQEESVVVASGEDLNGEEEVAKAIEEVNRAVEGEDDEKEADEPVEKNEAPIVAVVTKEVLEPEPVVEHEEEEVKPQAVAAVTSLEIVDEPQQATEEPAPVAVVTSLAVVDEPQPSEEVAIKENGLNDDVTPVPQENGMSEDHVTISHTNGSIDGPCIPSPDPSGQLGVNYEQKTVVSFSKDLGSEPNKYPDTVKVVKEGEVTTNGADAELQELAKLKFDIKADDQDVQVTPVLRAEE